MTGGITGSDGFALGQAWQKMQNALPPGWGFEGVARARYWPEGQPVFRKALVRNADADVISLDVFEPPDWFVARAPTPDRTQGPLWIAARGETETEALEALTKELGRRL
jgi:hypothetical protein